MGRTTENLLVSHSECEEEVQGVSLPQGQGRKDRVPPGRGFCRRVMRVTPWSQQWGEAYPVASIPNAKVKRLLSTVPGSV